MISKTAPAIYTLSSYSINSPAAETVYLVNRVLHDWSLINITGKYLAITRMFIFRISYICNIPNVKSSKVIYKKQAVYVLLVEKVAFSM